MATTADKLSAAISSKADIRLALEEKIGQDPGGVLSEYAGIIRALGGGRVSTVNGISPDNTGNVQLTAANLGISFVVQGEKLIINV